MRRPRPIPVLALCATLLFAGCTDDPAPSTPPASASDSAPSSTPSSEALLSATWTVPAATTTFIGAPKVVGDAVVSYFLVGEAMHIGAWSTTDGTALWQAAVGTSYAAGGYEYRVGVIEGGPNIAYLTPEDADGVGRVAVANAATGQVVATSEELWAMTRPERCDLEPTRVCLEQRSLQDSSPHVLAVENDGSLGSSSVYLPQDSRSLGQVLYGTLSRPGEMIGVSAQTGPIWERPYTEVFGGPDFTSDSGWRWELYDSNLLVGVGYAYVQGKPYSPLDSAMVGIVRDQGTTVWQITAAQFCDNPAAGQPNQPLAICAWAASETAGDDTGFDTTLQGIDPATGASKWSVPLDKRNITSDVPKPFFAEPNQRVILTADGAARVDLDSGEVTTLPSDSTLACLVGRDPVPVVSKGGAMRLDHQLVGAVASPCDVNASGTAQFTPSALRAAGLRVGTGSTWVALTTEGLQGFTIPA